MISPRKPTRNVRRGEIIYGPQRPFNGLHLIIRGLVKVCRRIREPSIVMEIYSADEFLGESSLVTEPLVMETASALEETSLMSWTAREIEQQIETHPGLGWTLLQMLTRRIGECSARIESLTREKCRERIIRGLLRFANRLGQPAEDGSVHLPPLSQQTI